MNTPPNVLDDAFFKTLTDWAEDPLTAKAEVRELRNELRDRRKELVNSYDKRRMLEKKVEALEKENSVLEKKVGSLKREKNVLEKKVNALERDTRVDRDGFHAIAIQAANLYRNAAMRVSSEDGLPFWQELDAASPNKKRKKKNDYSLFQIMSVKTDRTCWSGARRGTFRRTSASVWSCGSRR